MPLFWHDLSWVIPLRSDFLTLIFAAFTTIGAMNGYIFIILAMAWAWRPGFIFRLFPWIALSSIVNGYLKDYFQDPRPFAFMLKGYGADGFGMPSGHAQLAILFWGAVALELRSTGFPKGLQLLAALMAGGICFSRLYLGVHDVEDVTIGSLLGFILLAGFYFGKAFQEKMPTIAIPVFLFIICIIASLAWPGGVSIHSTGPSFAFMIGWYGTAIIVGKPHAVGGSLLQRLALIAIGFSLVILASFALHSLPPVQRSMIVLLFIGIVGAGWAQFTRRWQKQA
jgi:membrane-associated phospholipid phosphatase